MFRKRQHPRLQLKIPVQVRGSGVSCEAQCVEIGAGGMSLAQADQLGISLPVEISFELGAPPPISLCAVVWWKRDNLTGLRFDPSDRNRKVVEQFVSAELAR
jgi:hypothetical protein